jgi:hypothetical protein
MNIAKVIRQRIGKSGAGMQVEGDVNAVVAANVGERGQVTHVSSTQRAAADSSPKSAGSDGPKAA